MAITVTPLADPDYRPFSRRLAWLAADADGNPVGSAYVRIYSKPSQAHLSELELAVHPAERRTGVGSELLAAAADAAREHEATILVADATTGTPGDYFLGARGFAVGLTLLFTRLAIADVDNALVAEISEQAHPGYRLESWAGVVPDHLAQTFTDARIAMADAPVGDIEYGEEVWDVERTRFVAEQVAKRGDHLTTVAAVHEETGRIAAFTELVIPGSAGQSGAGQGDDGKDREGQGVDGQHYGTAVLAEHRGRGLARWIKAEGIRQAQAQFPDLAGLRTDTADTNHTMRRINDALGYQLTHKVRRYRLDLRP